MKSSHLEKTVQMSNYGSDGSLNFSKANKNPRGVFVDVDVDGAVEGCPVGDGTEDKSVPLGRTNLMSEHLGALHFTERCAADRDVFAEVKASDVDESGAKMEVSVRRVVEPCDSEGFLLGGDVGISLFVDLKVDRSAYLEILSGKGTWNRVITASEVVGNTKNEDMGTQEQLIDIPVKFVERDDIEAVGLCPNQSDKKFAEEKEGEFYASDLVWGKVGHHLWWPGQIFEPSAASKKAINSCKKNSYLIGYFGDRTSGWNKSLRIKPFRMHFSQMEKQSDLETFNHAVDCALDEVSRRVELGLSCQCLPQQVISQKTSQIFVNAGIGKESSRRYGGDAVSGASSYKPAELVRFIKSIALDPYEIDRLKLVISRAQLFAFYRWNGYYHEPSFKELGGLLKTDAKVEVSHLRDGVPPGKQVSSPKCKNSSEKEGRSRKKERSILDLYRRTSALPKEKNWKGKPHRKKRKMIDSICGNSKMKLRKVNLSLQSNHRKSSANKSNPKGGENIENIDTCNQKSPRNHEPENTSSSQATEALGFAGVEDSYWTDRIIQSSPEEKILFEPEIRVDHDTTSAEHHQAVVDTSSSLDHSRGKDITVLRSETEDQCGFVRNKCEEYSPTAFVLKFSDEESIPSIANLNKIFSQYGPLNESKTKILSKSKRAKVLFDRVSDAETAFSSAGKFSIFGHSLISYSLNYSPNLGNQAQKRKKKDAGSA